MPILLAAWMFLARRAYVRPLYTERAGLAMLLVAATLMLVGVLWLRRAIRVEV